MKLKKIHPYLIIMFSFLAVIATGTFFLAMPFASTSGKSIGFVNALFMSTSCVCVTGLAVVNVAFDINLFGKIVIWFLMEIGGLSFITIAVFFFSIVGNRIGIGNRFLLKEALNQSKFSGIVSLIKKIIIISFSIQIVCALINLIVFIPYCDGSFIRGLGLSLFHSAASFNNAGFDAIGADSLIGFHDNILLNATTIFMIILGGIGFTVLNDIFSVKKLRYLSLHTKIVLITTFILIISGTVLIKISMNNLSWLECLFTAVTARTAGFTTIDMSNLKPGAYLVIVLQMFVGASPCSTGGGVKTTTLAIVVLSIISFARGKKNNIFRRRIADNLVFKAFVLFTIGILIVLTGSVIMAFVQPELGIPQILFEVMSAFSTTGLSMGITASLNNFNKLLCVVLMFMGRLGPLTVIGVINKHWMMSAEENVSYVEEDVIVG